jgi:hypothetical protein
VPIPRFWRCAPARGVPSAVEDACIVRRSALSVYDELVISGSAGCISEALQSSVLCHGGGVLDSPPPFALMLTTATACPSTRAGHRVDLSWLHPLCVWETACGSSFSVSSVSGAY